MRSLNLTMWERERDIVLSPPLEIVKDSTFLRVNQSDVAPGGAGVALLAQKSTLFKGAFAF